MPAPGTAMRRERSRGPGAERFDPRAHRAVHLRLVERLALERDHAAPAARQHLLERSFDDSPVGIVGNERGERAPALAYGITDNALDVGFWKEAQEIDTTRRNIAVGRERNHRHLARARELTYWSDGERE